MGANHSHHRSNREERTPIDAEKSHFNEVLEYRSSDLTSLLQLREFFQDIKNGDRSTIVDTEAKIWSFIIFYNEWLARLESPSPFGPEVLHAEYEEWKQLVKKSYGSLPDSKLWPIFSSDIDRIRDRLEGNKAKKICFCLVDAVEWAFRYEEMPPKFDYKQMRKEGKGFPPLPEKCVMLMIEDEAKIVEYRAQHEKMTNFFAAMKYDRNRWRPDDLGYNRLYDLGNCLRDAVLEYLEWMLTPGDNVMLQKIYHFYKYRAMEKYEDKDSSHVMRHAACLRLEADQFKDRVIAAEGGKDEMELVETVIEFLKEGNLSAAAQRSASCLHPPKTHDTATLSKAFGPHCDKTDVKTKILHITETLDQEINRLKTLREKILEDPMAYAKCSSNDLEKFLSKYGQERKVLEETTRLLSGELGKEGNVGWMMGTGE